MFPSTIAEFAVMAAVVWGLYRLLDPLRRRVERALLRLLDPSRADIVDAEIMPNDRKNTQKE
jgi:hypothetical protein